MTPEEMAAALGATGLAAYRMTLVGNAAPLVDLYRQRITRPVPGDLVVEVSSFTGHERRGAAHECVGILVDHGTDSGRDDVEGSFTEADRRYTEEFWMLQPLAGGKVVRWTNAEFVAIARTRAQVQQWSS